MKYVLLGFLKVYRLLISPLYGDVCRYYPSCSAYAVRAVEYHGAVKGGWYAARRLLSCHPWAAGGYDPVRGTPEFDEEMRGRAETTATMDAGSHDGVSRVPVGHQIPQQLPERQGKQEAMTVVRGRGVK